LRFIFARVALRWATGPSRKHQVLGWKPVGDMKSGIHGDVAAEFNAFIGRDRELRELRVLATGARALTLCGAGGIGKTRLALHLLRELADGYPDGAWFVQLADLRQPELVASRIASVIGVTEEPGRPLLATLADALRSRRMLLCVDTCDHLIEACAQACQRLLASSAGLRVIATSREPLRVAAETVWQVPPLSLPSVGEFGPARGTFGIGPPGGSGAGSGTSRAGTDEGKAGISAARSDALRLFADRAAAAKPGFALGPANVRAVTEICRSLDGLPLAIELAAAWVRALTVEQIAVRLADRFKLLNSADRTAPARHRTLRDAINWSHDLLSPREKILLRRLSVFADWPLEMAEQACARATPGDDLAPGEILNLITALSDKSLVVVEPAVGGETRYRMLDTIREYAAARLAEAGESELMHRRFRDHTVAETENLALVGMARVRATWSARVEAIRRFEAENANLRQILGRALADGDIESGLRICVSMRPVWIIQGSFAEGAGWMDAFLAADGPGRSGLSDDVLGSALVGRAQLAMATDPDAAREYALEGLALCTSDAARFWAASALNLLAEVALHARDLDEAAARANAALTVAKPAGDRWNEGYAGGTLAATAAFRGDLVLAKDLAEEALAITYEIDQQWGSARALLGLGDLARLTGNLDQANQRYTDALAIVREINARPEIARCLAGLGQIAISRGDLSAAGTYFGDSLALSKSTGSRIGVIRGLDAFATLAAGLGRLESAVRLAGAAAALRSEASLPEAPVRTSRIFAAAAPLGDQAVSAHWEAGLVLGSDAAVELALSISEPDDHKPDSPPAAATKADPASGQPARAAQAAQPAQAGQPGLLTTRELQIADLIAAGASNKAIADQLVITPATAARHVANIMGKLGFNSRVQIAAWARDRASAGQTGR
jgi:predicted ATPase/DNA-binding CsgD family transcriptional regulator/tetratricopeptide (TPR) repeat protein